MEKIFTYSAWNDGVILLLESGKIEFVDKEIIAQIFDKYGGSFMQHIGRALYRADAKNTFKILITWESETREYIEKFITTNPFTNGNDM